MRNAEFNRETVLRSAMTAFLAKGYTKTSMQDLKQATGLHPGSIYCAFENKRGLLLAALGQYKADRNAEFSRVFTGDGSKLQQVEQYINHVVEECLTCDSARDCLLAKALNEVAEQDDEIQTFISDNLIDWENAIAGQLQLAIDAGELNGEKNAQHLAQYLVMGIYGLRTFAHTHPKPEVLHRLGNKLFVDICR
ncbi:TetR/AcrR family transcriptional regulator [Thalassotalea fusca]